MSDSSSKLSIAVSNDNPNRIRVYPQTWLVHVDGVDPVPVQVERDGAGKPHVKNSNAA